VLLLARALLLAAVLGGGSLACGGADDKKVAGPTDAELEQARAACAAEPSDPKSCAMLCERGREPACESLKNGCLIGGDATACFLLGEAYEREGDTTHASGAFKLACQGGQSAACDRPGDGSGANEPQPQ
jgi:hypothetical protein